MSTIPYVAGTRVDRARSAVTVALLRTLPANEKVVFDEVDVSGLTPKQAAERQNGLSARTAGFVRNFSKRNGLGVVYYSTRRDGDRAVATVYTDRSPVDGSNHWSHTHHGSTSTGAPVVTVNSIKANAVSTASITTGTVTSKELFFDGTKAKSNTRKRKRDYVASANAMLDRLERNSGYKLTLSALTMTGAESATELRSKRNAQYYLVRTLRAEAEKRGLWADFTTKKTAKAIRVDGWLL